MELSQFNESIKKYIDGEIKHQNSLIFKDENKNIVDFVILDNKNETNILFCKTKNKIVKYKIETNQNIIKKKIAKFDYLKNKIKKLDSTIINSFNVVSEIFTYKNYIIEVMDYSGDDLTKISSQPHKFKEIYSKSFYLFSAIYKAIKELHKFLIFHIDIKLNNICYNEITDTFVLIDFELLEVDKTKAILSGGTFNYSSPFDLNKFLNGEAINLKEYDEFTFWISIIMFYDFNSINKFVYYQNNILMIYKIERKKN